MIPDLRRSRFAFQFLPPMLITQNDPARLCRQSQVKEKPGNDGTTTFGNMPVISIVTRDNT
jgi:hypothetical protein